MRADNLLMVHTLVMMRDRCESWLAQGCSKRVQFMLLALPEIDAADADTGLDMNCGAIGNVRAAFFPLIARTIAGLQREPADNVEDRIAALCERWAQMQTLKDTLLDEIGLMCETSEGAFERGELPARLEFFLSMASPLIHQTLTVFFGKACHFLLVVISPTHTGTEFQCFGTGSFNERDLARAAMFVDKIGHVTTDAFIHMTPQGNA